MSTAPILLFCYNRPLHIKRTIEALKINELASDSELFIFSDGYKDESDKNEVENVRRIIESISGFKEITIVKRNSNWGLSKSVILGVSEIIDQFGKVIVVEDDLVTSPFFLQYMNDCLNYYQTDKKIFSISGYSPPIHYPDHFKGKQYITNRPCSWGWATWNSRWNLIDWELKDFNQFIRNSSLRKRFNISGKDSSTMLLRQMTGEINSWAIRFHYNCFKQNNYCIYPRISMLYNIGTDGSGTHLGSTNKYKTELSNEKLVPVSVKFDEGILRNFQKFYEPSVFRKVINYFKLLKYITQY